MSAPTIRRGGSGEPMVLIHGFSATGMAWEPVREKLEASFDVMIVNLAGHVGGPELAEGSEVSVDITRSTSDDAKIPVMAAVELSGPAIANGNELPSAIVAARTADEIKVAATP